jgi:hypothetical protein
MRSHLDRARRGFPAILGGISLVSFVVLLEWDASPALFPARAHRVLGALPLALIALAYLVYQFIRRPGLMEVFKALLLALAFLFWGEPVLARGCVRHAPQRPGHRTLRARRFLRDCRLARHLSRRILRRELYRAQGMKRLLKKSGFAGRVARIVSPGLNVVSQEVVDIEA